jgi:hypothetical protein
MTREGRRGLHRDLALRDVNARTIRRNEPRGGQMIRRLMALAGALVCVVGVGAQQPAPARPLSPPGATQAQVLGRWVKGDRPSFAVGQERYVDGKWLEITYGRPALRGRDVFGSGAQYGKAHIDLPLGDWGPPPVWRAGANASTRLKTEAALTIGGRKVPAGEYSLFIDVKGPRDWTLIVSSWAAQQRFDQADKTALWGAYGYTPEKDVARVAMKVDTLPFSVEQLTWAFVDMTPNSGRMAIQWAKTMASATFTAEMP